MAILRKLPSPTLHKTLSQSHSQGQGLYLLGPKTLGSRWLEWPSTCLVWLSTYPSHTVRRDFLSSLTPGFPLAESQMSHSIKQFIQSAVTPKQPKGVPLRRNQQQSIPLVFIPSQSLLKKLLLFPSESSALSSVSQCPSSQPVHLPLCPLLWQSTASCLWLLPPRTQPAAPLQLYHKYSSTTTCKRDTPWEKMN